MSPRRRYNRGADAVRSPGRSDGPGQSPSARRSYSRPASRRRSCCERSRFRSRIDAGVTSTSSSPAMNSIADFERDRRWRRQPQRLVVGVRPDIRELLLLRRVDIHVAGPAVLADDHPLVHLDARPDEQLGALLEVEQPIRVGGPGAVGNDDAARAVRDIACPRSVALADLVEQGRPPRVGEELTAIADQAADRQHVLHPDAAVGVGRHLFEAALPSGERRLDLADEVGRDVDR